MNDIWCFNVTTSTWRYVSGDPLPDMATPFAPTGPAALSSRSTQEHHPSRATHDVSDSSPTTASSLAAPSPAPGFIWNGLPKLSGAYAGVTSMLAPALANGNNLYGVWLSGGLNETGNTVSTYNISLQHLMRPSASNLPTLFPGTISPYGRSGAVLYPATSTLPRTASAFMFGGQAWGFPQFDRGTLFMDLPSANGFPCWSNYCSANSDDYLCSSCLASLPTTDYLGGIRYATLTSVYVNYSYITDDSTTKSLIIRAEVVLGGQNYNETTENGQTFATWQNNPDFATVDQRNLEGRQTYLSILTPVTLSGITQCPQASPVLNSGAPWLFQCVNLAWTASAYSLSSQFSDITLSSGAPAQMTGDWAPSALKITLEPGSLLNVTGVLSNASVSVAFAFNESTWSVAATNLVDAIPIMEAADFNSLDLSQGVALMLGTSGTSPISTLTLNCSVHTAQSAYLQSMSTPTGRALLTAVLNWQVTSTGEPGCPVPSDGTSVPVIAIVVGIVVPIAIVAVFGAIIYVRRRPRDHDTTEEQTEEAEPLPEDHASTVEMEVSTAPFDSITELSTSTPVDPDPTQSEYSADVSAPVPADSLVHRGSLVGATPQSGISRSDLDYESGLGSLDTSFDSQYTQDLSYMPNLAQV